MIDDLVDLSSIFFISGIQKQAILFLKMAILGFGHNHVYSTIHFPAPRNIQDRKRQTRIPQ